MAQTRRKRQTKHRGNAAGMVEARGRTGRRVDDDEKPPTRRAAADRRDRPPTWRSAINRAAITVVLFVAVVILAFGQSVASAIAIGMVMLVFYVPLGYYTDLLLYRRRQAKKLQARGGGGG